MHTTKKVKENTATLEASEYLMVHSCSSHRTDVENEEMFFDHVKQIKKTNNTEIRFSLVKIRHKLSNPTNVSSEYLSKIIKTKRRHSWRKSK